MEIEYYRDRISEEEYSRLLEELERWRTIENLTDIIWSVDMNLKFTYISPSVENLIGYTQEELMETSLVQLVTSESLSLIKKTLADALVRDATESTREIQPPIEIEAKHRDGTSVWLGLSRVFLRDENDNPTGILGVARDISDRVRTTQALEESEAKYRALSERSVLGIVIAQDNPIRLTYVNDTMERILGYPKEEIMSWRGEETLRLIHPEDSATFYETFQNRLENRPYEGNYDFRSVRKDGTIVWFQVHGTRIDYESEPAVLATFVNITKKKLAQQEAEEAREFTEFLIDLMGHDLSNIHQGLMTALELLTSHDDLPSEWDILLDSSLSELARASDLIAKVRILSDVKSKEIQREPTDIYIPISRAIDAIKKSFPLGKIRFESNIRPGMYIIFGCQFLFEVFYNLLHNAVKFDISETVVIEINVNVVENGTFIEIEVADAGVGISDSKKSSIFSRIGDNKTASSGIGLTLIKQIIERCQGEIWVEDRISGDYSKGAKFIIRMKMFPVPE